MINLINDFISWKQDKKRLLEEIDCLINENHYLRQKLTQKTKDIEEINKVRNQNLSSVVRLLGETQVKIREMQIACDEELNLELKD